MLTLRRPADPSVSRRHILRVHSALSLGAGQMEWYRYQGVRGEAGQVDHRTVDRSRAQAHCSHGFYAVIVDNGQIMYFDGAATPDQFQALLYASRDLDDGPHELLIVNENLYNASGPGNVCEVALTPTY